MDVHVTGFVWFAVTMIGSGAQYPPGHAASSARCDAGTRSAGRQCDPAHAGLHDGKVEGSSTGGPVHGQVNVTGGSFG